MITREKLIKCISNCKNAGDIVRERKHYVRAAILIMFSIGASNNQNKIIMIRRKQNLRKHGGQIAFPGGRYETYDKNLSDTALRETYEEINLTENYIEVLGSLPNFYTGTGYNVIPFIATLNKRKDWEKRMKPNPEEVETILICNAYELLNPKKHIRIKAPFDSNMFMTWKIDYKSENIWGLTARVLVTISAGLNLRDYPPCDDI